MPGFTCSQLSRTTIPMIDAAVVNRGSGWSATVTGALEALTTFPGLLAVTVTFKVEPRSAGVNGYRAPVITGAHPEPLRSQRYQTYASVLTAPFHAPCVAVSVSGIWGMPEIVGGVRLTSGFALTTPVSALSATVEPPAVVAVTLTAIRLPMSATARR